MKNTKEFENIISLGHFCSVALELERMGLRNASYPFDWVIAGNFEKVIELISNGFLGFMERDNLLQEYSINPKYYYDEKWEVHFYHDFSAQLPFDIQYDSAYDKYKRRIDRFFKDIKAPTLFIRYVTNQCELDYIAENNDSINALLKSFNPSNEIIYVSNLEKQALPNVAVFYVQKDKNDTVARRFLDKSASLKEFILSSHNIPNDKLKLNLKLAKKSIRKRKMNGIKRKINRLTSKLLPFTRKKSYRHSRQYVNPTMEK